MEELLKELGFTDEQIKSIVDGMKNKKIYTSTEENIYTKKAEFYSAFLLATYSFISITAEAEKK